MEDNVVLWTFNKGVRKFVKRGAENVPLARNQWHTLANLSSWDEPAGVFERKTFAGLHVG